MKPTTAPATNGLKSLIARVNSDISMEPKVAAGPKRSSVTGSVTRRVSIGTKKNFTRSGTILLNSFSHFDANHTARITGITVPV